MTAVTLNVNKQSTIGNLIFRNKTLQGSEIVFDYTICFLSQLGLSEADINFQAIKMLTSIGWKDVSEIKQQKTNISEIDDCLKSKTVASKRKGHADIYLLINDKLKVIIDNKSPKELVSDGIRDAIFYADCLRKEIRYTYCNEL